MAKPVQFTWTGLLLRFIFALILVFATYNPFGWSIWHWIFYPEGHSAWEWAFGHPQVENPNAWKEYMPLKVFVLITLVIGWGVYLRATWRSLGPAGVILALAFFAAFVWLLVEYAGLKLDLGIVTTVVILVILSAVLAVGMTWSLIRRRLSGQMDVDEVSDDNM